MTQTANETITTDLLLFFSADQVLPPAKKHGWQVPCTDTRVSWADMARLVFASAFWSLREQGLIGLEVLHTKRLGFFKTTKIQVTPLQQAQRPGLEGAIMQIAGQPRTGDVRSIVYLWFGQDVSKPSDQVIHAQETQAVSLGYMHDVDMAAKGFIDKIKSMGKREPDCTRIQALEDQRNAAVKQWQDFQTNEPELYEELMSQCGQAISSRRETQENNL